MNKSVFGVICLGLGASVGYALAYFQAKSKFKKLEEQNSNDMQEIRDYYREKYGEKEKNANVNTKKTENKSAEEAAFSKVLNTCIKENTENAVRLTLAKEIMNKNGYKGSEDDPDRFTNAAQVESDKKLDSTEPYMITRFEFDNEMPYFEKMTLIYHAVNGVVTTEDDEVIQDIDLVIGTECLNEFGNLVDEEDIVIVRNERAGVDYEIIREMDSFNGDSTPIDMTSM